MSVFWLEGLVPPNMSTSGHSRQTSQKFTKYAMLITTYLGALIFSAFGGALGDQGVQCSSGVCLPADYNKMDLPGLKPIHIDTQMLLMEIYEVTEMQKAAKKWDYLCIIYALFMLIFRTENGLVLI